MNKYSNVLLLLVRLVVFFILFSNGWERWPLVPRRESVNLGARCRSTTGATTTGTSNMVLWLLSRRTWWPSTRHWNSSVEIQRCYLLLLLPPLRRALRSTATAAATGYVAPFWRYPHPWLRDKWLLNNLVIKNIVLVLLGVISRADDSGARAGAISGSGRGAVRRTARGGMLLHQVHKGFHLCHGDIDALAQVSCAGWRVGQRSLQYGRRLSIVRAVECILVIHKAPGVTPMPRSLLTQGGALHSRKGRSLLTQGGAVRSRKGRWRGLIRWWSWGRR